MVRGGGASQAILDRAWRHATVDEPLTASESGSWLSNLGWLGWATALQRLPPPGDHLLHPGSSEAPPPQLATPVLQDLQQTNVSVPSSGISVGSRHPMTKTTQHQCSTGCSALKASYLSLQKSELALAHRSRYGKDLVAVLSHRRPPPCPKLTVDGVALARSSTGGRGPIDLRQGSRPKPPTRHRAASSRWWHVGVVHLGTTGLVVGEVIQGNILPCLHC